MNPRTGKIRVVPDACEFVVNENVSSGPFSRERTQVSGPVRFRDTHGGVLVRTSQMIERLTSVTDSVRSGSSRCGHKP